MSGGIKFGCVLSWKNYVLPDKAVANKLLVVLGAKPNNHLLLALTTSKPFYRKIDFGCAEEHGVYMIPGGGKHFFREETVVQVYRPQVALVELAQSKAHVIGALPPDIAAAVRNCMKRSKDVSPFHLSLME